MINQYAPTANIAKYGDISDEIVKRENMAIQLINILHYKQGEKS